MALLGTTMTLVCCATPLPRKRIETPGCPVQNKQLHCCATPLPRKRIETKMLFLLFFFFMFVAQPRCLARGLKPILALIPRRIGLRCATPLPRKRIETRHMPALQPCRGPGCATPLPRKRIETVITSAIIFQMCLLRNPVASQED